MKLFLRIKSGKRQGDEFHLRDGMKIGRKNADIMLPDPKVSSLHAIVEKKGKSRWRLLDQGSRNKIQANDKDLQELYLKPGQEFQLGATVFEVFDRQEDEAIADWRMTVLQVMKKLSTEPNTIQREVHSFHKLMSLHYLTGNQAGKKSYLGYGPRFAGPKSSDIPILEDFKKHPCFQIFSRNKKFYFATDYPKDVKLNSKSQSEAEIKAGDLIQIGNTEIQVEFPDESY